MDKFDPALPHDDADAASDLARRLARYRRRVEAEDRPRSLKLIDRAVWPRLARVITARIMVAMAPAVSEWIAALRGTRPARLRPSKASPTGIHR
jgi:hypothetical protein